MQTLLAMAQTTTGRAFEAVRNELVNTPLSTDLDRARHLAHWLDAKFEVAGLRFGLNGLVGLLPVAGDTMSTLAGTFPIYVAWKHKLGSDAIVKMAGHLAIQWFVGLLPWVGDYAEVWYKANLRNLAVLERAAAGRD